ncbi:MAG: SgcJ/EcaC family oxidoreductase [Planctomycetia bacterium]|nr:SgcJ/EcaC family oxidoreductase [Planctomycetia bacterium]
MMRTTICLTLALCGGTLARAQDKKQPSGPSGDEATIRRSVASFIDAFNRGDAKALAAHWAEEGIYLNPQTGERLAGREEIAKAYAAMFAEGGSPKLSVSVDSLRLLDDKVAVEEGLATVRRGDEAPENDSYIAIHVKRDGKWQLESVRETILPGSSDESSGLADIAWMIGRWHDEDDASAIETVCEWTANKTFMTRSFKIATKDGFKMSGTQVIGWDPAERRIRSWVFDSVGGFGGGEWTRQGDRWLIKATSTLPDGKKATSVQIITKIDDDSFTWQSIGREVDGELLPNVAPITAVRSGGAR